MAWSLWWPGRSGQGGLAENSAGGDGGKTPEDLKVVWGGVMALASPPLFIHSFIHPLENGIGIILIFDS